MENSKTFWLFIIGLDLCLIVYWLCINPTNKKTTTRHHSYATVTVGDSTHRFMFDPDAQAPFLAGSTGAVLPCRGVIEITGKARGTDDNANTVSVKFDFTIEH